METKIAIPPTLVNPQLIAFDEYIETYSPEAKAFRPFFEKYEALEVYLFLNRIQSSLNYHLNEHLQLGIHKLNYLKDWFLEIHASLNSWSTFESRKLNVIFEGFGHEYPAIENFNLMLLITKYLLNEHDLQYPGRNEMILDLAECYLKLQGYRNGWDMEHYQSFA